MGHIPILSWFMLLLQILPVETTEILSWFLCHFYMSPSSFENFITFLHQKRFQPYLIFFFPIHFFIKDPIQKKKKIAFRNQDLVTKCAYCYLGNNIVIYIICIHAHFYRYILTYACIHQYLFLYHLSIDIFKIHDFIWYKFQSSTIEFILTFLLSILLLVYLTYRNLDHIIHNIFEYLFNSSIQKKYFQIL